MAGRHRGRAAPGAEGDEPLVGLEHAFEYGADHTEYDSPRPNVAMLVSAAVLIPVVLIGAVFLLLDHGASGQVETPTPSGSTVRASAVASTLPPSASPEPTQGAYVPPRVTATPTVRRSTPPPPKKSSPPPSASPRPTCPFPFPMAQEWCRRHGF